MLAELSEAIEESVNDYDVGVVTITGSGRCFCGGGDHRYIETLIGPSEGVADFGFIKQEHIKFL